MPGDWTGFVKSAAIAAISWAHHAITRGSGHTTQSKRGAARRAAEIGRLRAEIALLREELRIKDARMARIPARRRPHYTPCERLAILEVRAARGWSTGQTARVFQVTLVTITEWTRRVDEQGPSALVQLGQPVNKFPAFVGYLVRRLKTLCPLLGRRKIAALLARAGLHLSATTIRRMLRERIPPQRPPVEMDVGSRAVTARRPHEMWHVDLTLVPIVSGFWTVWFPCALPQRWPFCWWLAVVVDGSSRRALGTMLFDRQPAAAALRRFLGQTVRQVRATPRLIVCDRGRQFDCHGLRRWCRRRKIQVRYGAVGRHGSIALVERFIRTFKEECVRRLPLVPLRRERMQQELRLFVGWYHHERPHAALAGRTPHEVCDRRFPACRKPRYEPRARWPRGSPCAQPWALTRGRPGARLELRVEFQGGRRHLPVVTLRRVA